VREGGANDRRATHVAPGRYRIQGVELFGRQPDIGSAPRPGRPSIGGASGMEPDTERPRLHTMNLNWFRAVALGATVATGCACTAPTPPSAGPSSANTLSVTTRTEEFQGHYVAGFETSSFVPCPSTHPPGYGHGWWLEGSPASGFDQRYREVLGPALADQIGFSGGGIDPARIVYARFTGTTRTGAAGYGHLSQYTALVTVGTLIEMSRDGACR
jgi:hypothetical protein